MSGNEEDKEHGLDEDKEFRKRERRTRSVHGRNVRGEWMV